ncbi:hypothetical protein AB1E22_05405 [Buttiauxella gaviniae]|uniref:Uncharacterized protein n=1 Tax=Buttiauxella gaviniae TaxID=82990 RepID=A0ABV3NRJ4_9ENTR
MTHGLNLAAVRITLGNQHFYIPATQVQSCVLVDYEAPDIPRFSQWLGLPDEPECGMHLHLFVPASNIAQGWYLWGELENVVLRQHDIFPLPALLQQCNQLPAIRALVQDEGISPLLSW